MSWEEVGKINSDYTREPLNFNNYINDISTFGKYSYVLDPENSKLWRDLICQSLVMFGHSAIHDTVYECLTDTDVDYMLRHNTRLGQAFNSFYSVSDFTSGRIDSVLSAITAASYNVLELKFQSGINRYVSEKTSGNTAGEWLGTVFGIASLKSKTTMASIISDTTLWNNTVAVNESLWFVICLSVSAAEYMASHSNSSNYVSFIETVAQSTDATMTLINALAATDQLGTFFANERVCTAIANSAPSMTAICYNTDGFAAMIASETAMTIVAASETAVNVIVEGITNAANSEAVLDGIKGNLTSIEEALPSITNTETVIAEVADVKENISGVVTSLHKVTSQTDVLVKNIDALFESETAMTAIASNNSVMIETIIPNEIVVNKVMSSAAAMNIIASSEAQMTAVCESSIARNALYNNANVTTSILASSSIALSVMKSSSRCTAVNASGTTEQISYNGKAFVFEVWASATNNAFTSYHGRYITGDSIRTYSSTSNHQQVNCFASAVTAYNSSAYWTHYAKIFII